MLCSATPFVFSTPTPRGVREDTAAFRARQLLCCRAVFFSSGLLSRDPGVPRLDDRQRERADQSHPCFPVVGDNVFPGVEFLHVELVSSRLDANGAPSVRSRDEPALQLPREAEAKRACPRRPEQVMVERDVPAFEKAVDQLDVLDGTTFELGLFETGDRVVDRLSVYTAAWAFSVGSSNRFQAMELLLELGIGCWGSMLRARERL
jgi:hypothetical protein